MVDEASETQLSISEGVLLGHALVARVAENLGIRAFFIKGPASVVQGLRQPKTSTDVDVFVDPSSLEHMLQGLRERGWRDRPVDSDSKCYPRHSVTVDHPKWPCCIDVHFRFPGMEEPELHCFEVMWANTGNFEFAGYRVRVPTNSLGILILALHALRSPQLPACRQELGFLTHLSEQQSHVSDIVEIATLTGSLAAVRPFLERFHSADSPLEWPEPSTEWRNRQMAREPGSARLIAILQAPWEHKLKMLWRAVFPAPEALLSVNIYADMSVLGRVAQNGARWTRFLRSAPQIIGDLCSPGNTGTSLPRGRSEIP